MKTVGLIGGMSWESTQEYYRDINLGIKKALGGLHSGKILMHSFDFDEIENLQHKNKWTELEALMVDTGKRLKQAGADFLAICTNTMHKVADEVEAGTGLKVIHIADVTAENILKQNNKIYFEFFAIKCNRMAKVTVNKLLTRFSWDNL